MDITLLSAVFLLLVLLDPLGNLPIFIATVERLEPGRRKRVIARECLIAWVVLLAFTLMGNQFMGWLQLSEHAIGIAGGIILFIIALRMIFRRPDGVFGEYGETSEPLVFPLAVPLFAGPSAIAFVLLLTSKEPDRLWEWMLAVTIACLISTVVVTLGSGIMHFVGRRGMRAMETLLGLLLTAIATQMLLDGISVFLQHLRQ